MKIPFPTDPHSSWWEKFLSFFSKLRFHIPFKFVSQELSNRFYFGALCALGSIALLALATSLPQLLRLVASGFALWLFYELRRMEPFAFLPRRLWLSLEVGSVVILLSPPSSYLLLFALLIAAAALIAIFFDLRIEDLSLLVFALIYCVAPLAILCYMNEHSFGFSLAQRRAWLGCALFSPKVYDMGAYFFGKTLGKHVLLPQISPRKTLEGFLGGFIFVGLFLALLTEFFQIMTPGQLLLSFVSVPLLAQFGDLFESWIKRRARARHSGSLPGLGGLLDLSDALVWCAPYFLYLYQGGFR